MIPANQDSKQTHRPAFVFGLLPALLCFGLVAPADADDVPARRPNVLWLVADDLSPDLGSYGAADAITPHLDQLAREGTRFTNAVSTAPVCAPSRSALITGVYPTTLGSHGMRSWGVPPAGTLAFPVALRRAGYFTANRLKTDENLKAYRTTPRSSIKPQGLDIRRSVSEPLLGAWDISGPTAHWRDRPDPDQPWFVKIDLFVTHESRIRMPDDQFAEQTAAVTPQQRHDPAEVELPPYYPDRPEVRRDVARYHDLVTAADHRVGELLAELEEDGLANDTVVIFFGDHGRGLSRAKRWLWESGIHVPLIVRWPGKVSPGSVRDDLVTFVDYAPTVLSLAGLEQLPQFQGRVFLGEGTQTEPEFVIAVRDRMDETHDRMRAVRGKRWKLIRNFHPELPWSQRIDYMDQMPTMKVWRELAAKGELDEHQMRWFAPSKPEFELYDLEADPHELHDLAPDPRQAARVERMARFLDDWIEQTGDLGALPEDELIARMRPEGLDLDVATPSAEWVGGHPEPWRIELKTGTESAAIVYRWRQGGKAADRWLLYDEPIAPPAEPERSLVLEARAGRLGWLDSEALTFEVADH